MTEIATALASKAAAEVAAEAAKPLLARVRRQCEYVISTDRYIGQLDKGLEKLNDVRVEVQRSVDHADNNMWEIKREVNGWKNNAETVAKKARSVLDNDGRAKKTCFCGWLPNPKGRYCLGRDARKTAEAIQELIPLGRFEKVYYEDAPPGLVGGAPNMNTIQELTARGQLENPPPGRVGDDGGDTIQELSARGQFEKVDIENPPPVLVGVASGVNSSASDAGDFITGSRASIFQDIMKALDDENLKVIGVYGPGGVGKTTLLKEVEKKLGEPGRPFRMIVKVRVSQTPDLNNIVDQIADAFGLELKDKRSLQGKADVLSKRLKSNPDEKVLIIFDNLWEKLDLEAIGIPWRDVSNKCKLLLTSRFEDVVEQEMGADRTFLLQGLTDGEAFKLFENKVGDKLKDNEELKSIADQVVKKLAGLPLLINSVANTLKSSDVSAWRNALIELDDSNKIKKETIVKLSYDHLKSEDAKYLFLLCGLIGGTIQVKRLFVLAMGLGLFERFNKTMQDSRDRLNNMLNELRSACLLLDVGDDKDKVTIHDLYSEVVVSTPFRDQNSFMMSSNYASSSKEKLEKCWAICLDNVGRDRLAELMMCQFPSLKILMLSMPKVWGWSEEHQHDRGDCSGLLDFKGMKELQVLYLRFIHITNLPPSIEILGNLRSLYLHHCNVKDVAILGKLKALQNLTLAQSTISRLPKEIGELTNLRSLNLSKCYLETIAPGVLNRLTNLEELHIYHFSQWMGKDQIPSKSCNARLAELKSLTKLASLEISIYNPIILLEAGDLPFENLDKFRINIGKAEVWTDVGMPTMAFNLRGHDSVLSRKWVKKNLQKTQFLYLSGCSEFKESPHKLCSQEFQEVKRLHIGDSPSIKYIVDSSNDLPLTAFGKLESFSLENLINLEKICHGPIAPECFNKLKDVRVERCNRLKYLWRLSNVQRLVQLEEIDVFQCRSMQSIVTHDAGEDIVSTNNRVELPNVRRLRLRELPNMKSFCDTSIQVSLPHLESLIMIGFLDPEKILYSELSSTYSYLRSLLIRASKSTSKSILKLDWILKLSNLESMSLGRFPSAEVVFDLKELKVIEDVEICSLLTKLTLEKLPNLQCMWKQDVKLQGISIFRNLRDLFVYKTGLSFLFSMSVAKCFREIRVIRVWDCENMKAVIVDEEGRNEGTYDIVEFPLLEDLSIRQCPMEKFFLYPHGKKESVTTTSDLQDAYSNSFFDQKVTFPNITSLKIDGLPCQEIWNNQIPTDSFQKLEYLVVKKCDKLQSIATSYMWKRLQRHLEILRVVSCRSIKIIYEGDGTDIEGGKLRRLVLRDLENLMCIWQSDRLPSVPFPNLRNVEAVRCPRLEMLFPTFTTIFLEQIEELIVDSCGDMKLIAGHEKGEGATHTTITFSELTILMLVELPNFERFLPEKYSLKFPCSEDFPSLRELSVKSCGAEPNQVLGHSELHRCLRSGGIDSWSEVPCGDEAFENREIQRGMEFWK